MGKKLYVGNLPFSLSDQDLTEIFTQVGQVESASVIIDRYSGRSKGFGFVEMSSETEAQAGISQFNGADLQGRAMTVSEAKPAAPREGGRDSRGGGGGGGGFQNRRGNGGGGGSRF